MRILIPDAQFEGGPDIERSVAPAEAEFDVHRAASPAEIPEESWQKADAILVWHVMTLNADVVARLDNCRIIVRAGIGVDRIDLEACARRGIRVCNVPDYGITDVADHAIALLLSLVRGVPFFHDRLREDPVGGWRWDAPPLMGRVRGRRFGIVGLGRIGTAAARRAQAHDMEVMFYDPYLPSGQEQAVSATRVAKLEDLLAEADVVSLHAPLTEETHHMMDAVAFARMKEGAILINTARGGLVDPTALLDALEAGKPAGAGIDVLPDEPPAPNEPLVRAYGERPDWLDGRLILTPHAAFYSPASIADLRRKPMGIAAGFLQEGRLKDCVNLLHLARHGHAVADAAGPRSW